MNAQTSQVATLLHDGQLSIFYTGMALQQAYEAAVDGDVITLSAGMFNAVNINKNVVIRGAGMGLTDSGENTSSTIISGRIEINNPTVEGQGLTLEGLDFMDGVYYRTLNNAIISKCRFSNYIEGYSNATCNGLNVIQSIFEYLVNLRAEVTATFTNCLFKYAIETSSGSGNSYEFNNCVFLTENYFNRKLC